MTLPTPKYNSGNNNLDHNNNSDVNISLIFVNKLFLSFTLSLHNLCRLSSKHVTYKDKATTAARHTACTAAYIGR